MALTKSSKLMFTVVFVAVVFLLSSQLAFAAPHDFIPKPMLGRKLLQYPPYNGGGYGFPPTPPYPQQP
ncbi:hypothetical protein SLEP1_g55046 [Rubroshorea leprosula]|uniref:Transmembrane protein n=1 Tax=Rubroshorea leprosula TaxID=152421 RepID=A0AAV5ME95_9ROSI|nr:hypothetical protein SLEP1_g55046 [Rubroshorea leprosula]